MSNEYDCPSKPGGHEWINDLRTDFVWKCENCNVSYTNEQVKRYLKK